MGRNLDGRLASAEGRLVPDRDEPFIQSVRQRIRISEVIALTKFDAMPTQTVTFSRRNVFKRDKMTCHYCGKQPGSEELTIDHVVPRAQGGQSTWTNCVLACIDCNSRKADRTPAQAHMKLRKEPVRPAWKPIYADRMNRVKSWSKFISEAYWLKRRWRKPFLTTLRRTVLIEEVTRMANKSLFASLTSRLPRANAVNEAGGRAYKLEPKHALAQVAATGTFGNAFYSTAETQLDEVLKLIDEVDYNQYLAKLALYARENAFMKDMPAALLVALSVRDTELMHRVFDRVVDNGRVLRTVFQMIRSGQFKNKASKGRVGCRALSSERSSVG